MRGEKLSLSMLIAAVLGSPPHARGKGSMNERTKYQMRITPACAGKSLLFLGM